MAKDDIKINVSIEDHVRKALDVLIADIRKQLAAIAKPLPGQTVRSNVTVNVPQSSYAVTPTGQIQQTQVVKPLNLDIAYTQPDTAGMRKRWNELRNQAKKWASDPRMPIMGTKLGDEFKKFAASKEKITDERLAILEDIHSRMEKTIAKHQDKIARASQRRAQAKISAANLDYLTGLQDQAVQLASKYGLPFKSIKSGDLLGSEQLLRKRIAALKQKVAAVKASQKQTSDLAKAQQQYEDIEWEMGFKGSPLSASIINEPDLMKKLAAAKNHKRLARRAEQRQRKIDSANAANQRKADRAFDEMLITTHDIPALQKELEGLSKLLNESIPTFSSTKPRQLKKEMQRAAQGMRKRQKDRENIDKAGEEKMRHLLMSSASIGIGLLGSAAMPLLNVAFASWSGGPKMAVPAAAATIVGESVRAIEKLRDAALNAANSIGLYSEVQRREEAKLQAGKAFYGVAVRESNQRFDRGLYDALKENPRGVSNFEAWYGGLKSGFSKTFWNYAADPIKSRSAWKWAADPLQIGGFWVDWMKNASNDVSLGINTNRFAQEDAIKKLEQRLSIPTVGIENDPYSSWMRIQESAMNPLKDEEYQLGLQMLEVLKDMNRKMQEQENQAMNGNPIPPKTTFGQQILDWAF